VGALRLASAQARAVDHVGDTLEQRCQQPRQVGRDAHRGALAAVDGLGKGPQLRDLVAQALQDRGRGVRRAVVDDQDLRAEGHTGDSPNDLFDRPFLVERRYDNAHEDIGD
jgi:hypothetical protein